MSILHSATRRIFAWLLIAASLTSASACGDSNPTQPQVVQTEAEPLFQTASGFAARTVAGGPFNLRTGPGTNYTVVGTIRGNTPVTIVCQAYGTTVSGNWGPTNIWDKLSTGAWITDGYVYTGRNGLVTPLCGSTGGGNTGGGSITPGARGDNYPYKNDPAVFNPKGCVADRWAFCKRNCTSFVAWRLEQVNGIKFHNRYGSRSTTDPNDKWGDASRWAARAAQLGYAVDNTPRVGDVAWWSSGHVAWVAAVSSDGRTVTIEDYNGAYTGVYRSKTISASTVSKFIHLR